MAKMNVARVAPAGYTHEGAVAHPINPMQALKRTLMACLLWESHFYEEGQEIGKRICDLVKLCKPEDVSRLAIEARTKGKLRHAPLLVARELARVAKGRIVGDTIYNVIQRADELTEFLAIYWRDNKDQSLSAQVKKGLARAFRKFDEYQLAKYNRDGAVKLKDVLFLTHAKPKDDEQAALWKRLASGELATPDTWEVALSGGADKRASFERLMAEKKLFALAFLRNLRNMQQSGVTLETVQSYLRGLDVSRVLPFRFIAAARAVPMWEPMLDESMQKAMASKEKLNGRTVLLVDVSGSMSSPMSAKSDLSRLDAAKALAILLRGISDCRVFIFNDRIGEVPPRAGMALADAIGNPAGGTYLGAAVEHVNTHVPHDRLVVVTDEQSADAVPSPKGRGYMINVASAKNGVGYGPWLHIDGFSESVIDFAREHETENPQTS